MTCFMKWLLLGNFLVHFSKAGYVLQVELQSFSNPLHILASGDCCEVANTQPTCEELCDVAFVYCWKSYSSTSNSVAENACISRGSIGVYGDTDSINFPLGPLHSNAQNPPYNPLTIAGDVWPGGMQLFIRVVHANGSSRLLIDHFRIQESLAPGTTTAFRTYSGTRNNANIVVRFSLSCTANYYQPNCSIYCAPQDSDSLGHYTCEPDSAKKVCLSGYSNPSTNCTACATATGCSQENAFCIEPNDCICREGYSGLLCQQDMDVCGHTRPCLRGTCTNQGPNAFQCNCPTNYFGPNCEHYYEENVSCSDTLCSNRGKCISETGNTYNCSCHEGYGGVNCTDDLNVCAHLAPCQNGANCTNTGPNTYSCQCTEDYSGSECDSPTVLQVPNTTVTTTSPSASSTAEPTVSESHHSLPTLPVIVGSVIGGLVVITIILSVLLCAKNRDCLPNRRKLRRDPDTSNVYTDVRSARVHSLSSSNQHPSSSLPDSNQISDPTTELQQQQEFTNPLYSETDHYSSIVDCPQRRDSGARLSASHYSNPIELSNSSHDYQQDKNSVEKSFERAPSPHYMVIQERQASFHTPTSINSPNTPTKRNLGSLSHSFSGMEDEYSEPADSLRAAKQPPLYHILENEAPESTTTSSGVSIPESVPPLYMVLEESSGPVKVPISSEYAEATELSRHPRSNSTTILPEYEELDT